MECAQTGWLSDKAYFQQFQRKIIRQRIPISGSIDLTHRCNLRCVHCYLGNKEVVDKKEREELNTEKWLSVIDEIVDAGCLFLLITGGEPLLRRDFGKIYSHAKKKGLLVTVFTNGTLISDEILELFHQLPPQAVDITLYGATAETYEKITGIKGSYRRCIEGIQRLKDHQINFQLKTILMTFNRHEYYDIENIAKEYGVKFRFDAVIFPRFNGDRTPIDLRVPPEEVVEIEFSDDKKTQEWQKLYDRTRGIPLPDTLYQCGTGHTTFHITPYGNLRPCLMVTNLQYDLSAGSFMEGWCDVMPRIRERKASPANVCKQCERIALCRYCPSLFALESGGEEIRSEYTCETGQYRHNALKMAYQQGGYDEACAAERQ